MQLSQQHGSDEPGFGDNTSAAPLWRIKPLISVSVDMYLNYYVAVTDFTPNLPAAISAAVHGSDVAGFIVYIFVIFS